MPRKSRRPVPQVRSLEDRTVPTADLSGLVFADMNANGVRDTGEPGLAGITVQLDRTATAAAATVQTDAAGAYTFANVADGSHTVTITPTASTVPTGDGVVRTVPVAGTAVTGLNVGLQPTGKLSGTIFADLNANGKRDADEPGIAASVVSLDLFSAGGVNQTAVTGSDGTYSFANVPDGTHRLAVTASLNYSPVSQGPMTATVANGATVTGLDAGYKPLNAIQGKVTLGAGSATGTGLGGVTVQLDINSDSKIDFATTTDANGNYLFANVLTGKHTVSVVVPSNAGVDTPDGTPRRLVTVGNDLTTGVNFGVTYPGSMTGSLFVDTNGNGVRDASEVGLPPQNLQLDLYNAGTLIPVAAKAGTDGAFTVAGLPDGTHTLVVVPGGGYAATTATRVTVTISNGGAVAIDPIGLRQSVGGTVALGNGSGPGAVVYTFTTGTDGKLTATTGQTVVPPTRGSSRVLMADVNRDGVDDLITAPGAGDCAARPGVRRADRGGGHPRRHPGVRGHLRRRGEHRRRGLHRGRPAGPGGGRRHRRRAAGAGVRPGPVPGRGGPGPGQGDRRLLRYRRRQVPGRRRVAAGDLNADGTADLIVSAGAGGGPRVAVFDGTTIGSGKVPMRLVADFFAYESTLRNGAVVSVGDFNADGKMDLVTGAGPGGTRG